MAVGKACKAWSQKGPSQQWYFIVVDMFKLQGLKDFAPRMGSVITGVMAAWTLTVQCASHQTKIGVLLHAYLLA